MAVDSKRLVTTAVTAYSTLLADSGSPVLADPAMQAQLNGQVEAVVRSMVCAFLSHESSADECASDASEYIGEERARGGIHPTQSLRAASLMFEALFPILVDELGSRPSQSLTVEVGTALEREIQQRLAVGSIPYVNYLLTKLLSSQQDERSRIARDLHDRIAHGMGAALQQLDLFDHYRTRDASRAETHLATARESIRASFDSTRQVSADLWVRLRDVTIGAALESYLDTTVSEGTRSNVVVGGDDPHLLAEVTQELYLLLREAVRNAVVHGKPALIDVELVTDDDLFRAVVTDDGCGFDVEAVTSIRTVGGLASIRERAELLGGRASITSVPGRGTTVAVHLPLPGRVTDRDGDRRW